MRGAAAAVLLLISAAAAIGAVVLLIDSAGDDPDPPRREYVDVAGYAPAPAPVQAALPEGAPEAAPDPERERAPREPTPPKRKGPPPLPRVDIPSIDVSAHIVSLRLTRGGALQAPPNYTDVGWWSGGNRPGEKGPAVLAGHVDSGSAPAVFARLGALRRGDTVTVVDRRGRHTFRVVGAERAKKTEFPTARVYGDTDEPTLRLITCGGPWDAAKGHYRDNLIVYAKAV